jgi:glycerol-3-phosphate acyltransferase PlsY
LLKGIALNFAVLGHNYSILAYLIAGKFDSGRGLATGGGGLLAYNPLYLLIALSIGIPSILLTRYLLVGQVLTPVLLPAVVYLINKEDFYPILSVCILVLIRHLERMRDFLKGKEPRLYIDDKHQS